MTRPKISSFILIAVVFLMAFNLPSFQVKASPDSSYAYKFNVNAEGSTDVEINFSSSDTSGTHWVVVPKFSSWNYTYTPSGASFQYQTVPTTDVGLEDLYFYEAFSFHYTSSSSFSLKVQFSFDNGALIIDDRGIFFSPQISYKRVGLTSVTAEVLFDSHMRVIRNNAVGIGSQTFLPSETSYGRVFFNLPLSEDLMRLQIEFDVTLPLQSTIVESQSQIFSFETPDKYVDYATNIMNVYDEIYSNLTGLFHVALTPPIEMQFFLPSFEELLSLGGFTPFSSLGAGKININVFFIRAVNGTIEVIAVHELIHHFLIESDLSPNVLLWFHEGLAQYVSVTVLEQLGYEGAADEKKQLEQNVEQLISYLGGENFGFLQDWSPSVSPQNVGNYYVASYYVTSRLAEDYGGLDFYNRFFDLIHGVDVSSIDILALYLSRAANASVVFTLQEWGFTVADLFTSKETRDKITQAQDAIASVNPVFQPYKALAELLYRQALDSFRHGDNSGGMNLLEISILVANLAPLLTLVTFAAIIGSIFYLLRRHSRRRRMMPKPTLPPPPPEMFPKTEQ
jgi:hypothetical protein